MGDTILLPGTIPGLLRRGSPAVCRGIQCIVVALDCEDAEGGRGLLFASASGACRVGQPSDLSLDLTDATGRAHAAWWLGRSCGTSIGERDEHGLLWRWPDPLSEPGWWLESHESVTRFVRGAEDARYDYAVHVPSLADLDPNDTTLLPDGSRRVDAEALRRVVLHVAGIAT